MAWTSAEAARIVGSGFLQTVTRNDLVPELQEVVSRGWVLIDRAVLLAAWYESYFGERSRFPDTRITRLLSMAAEFPISIWSR